MKITFKSRCGADVNLRILKGLAEKPALIFVHGFAGGMWDPQYRNYKKYFKSFGYTVVEMTQAHTMRFFPADITNFHIQDLEVDLFKALNILESLGYKKVIGIGHSLGGAILLDFKHSALFGKVVINPFLKATEMMRLNPQQEIYDKIVKRGMIRMLKTFRRIKVTREIADEVSKFDIMNRAENINGKILFILGLKDLVAPFATAQEFVGMMKEKPQIEIFEKLGHGFFHPGMNEVMRKINTSIHKWLNEQNF